MYYVNEGTAYTCTKITSM